jgi:putative cardiolipin synthase
VLQNAGKVKLRDDVAVWIDAHPNIELRLFNPWTRRDLVGRLGEGLSDLKRINQRMHNKVLIADNRAAILGGRNIGDEYMGLHAEFNFHDLDVLGVGPIARQSSAVFDRYWNSRWVVPVSALGISASTEDQADGRRQLQTRLEAAASLRRFPLEPESWTEALGDLRQTLLPGTSVVRADLPTDTGFDQLMLGEIRALLASPRSELLLVNAYIIPAEQGMNTLRALNEQGIEVRVLTNSLASQDVPAVNSHYRKWRKPIVETGASLYEMRHDAAIQAGFVDTPPVVAKFMGLHSKAMVVDRRHVYIGSMNFDPRSANTNTEMGAFIDSPALGEALAALILRDTQPDNSWRVEMNEKSKLRWTNDTETVTRQPARNFWQRIEDIFFRAFPEEYY